MTFRLSKNFHGVGIGPLSKILAVKSCLGTFYYLKIQVYLLGPFWKKSAELLRVLNAWLRYLHFQENFIKAGGQSFSDIIFFSSVTKKWRGFEFARRRWIKNYSLLFSMRFE